jgi:hypothetical protein
MNSSTDHGSVEPDVTNIHQSSSVNWRVAFMELIASRIAIIQLESKEAASDFTRRAILLTAAAGCIFATWALSLAGGITWIAQVTQCHWSRVALAAALIHFLAAAILTRKATRPIATAFMATRNEFLKDRKWIETFQTSKKSSD